MEEIGQKVKQKDKNVENRESDVKIRGLHQDVQHIVVKKNRGS